MLIRTVNTLPRVINHCTKCASEPAFRSKNFVRTNLCDNVSLLRRFTTLTRNKDAVGNDRYSSQRRFLFAAASGAAESPSTRFETPSRETPFESNSRLHQHSSESPKELCSDFLVSICDEIKSEMNTSMAPLRELAHYLFDGKGKYIRPQIIYLLAVVANKTVASEKNASVDAVPSSPLINERQLSVCRIAEMIHTASLIHDDVIDGSAVRRGQPTIHALWGESKAVITGDYILSVASRKGVSKM